MSKQDYGTPWTFVRAVETKLGRRIAFDLAASSHNTKHERFFAEEQNSLVQDWHKIDGLLWLNPPFANARPWVKKCKEEAAKGALIASLTLAAVGSNWFADHVYGNALVLLFRPRIVFDGMEPNPKTGKVDPFMKDCMVCVWDRNTAPRIELWDWSKELAMRHERRNVWSMHRNDSRCWQTSQRKSQPADPALVSSGRADPAWDLARPWVVVTWS